MKFGCVRAVCLVWAVSLLLGVTSAHAAEQGNLAAREAAHYRIEDIPVPKGVELEVGGMAFAPDGTLYVSTRRGEIWTLRPDRPNAGAGTWKLFATGLHESLGVLVEKKGQIIVAQRPELTRLTDRNGDGRADSYETLTQAFGVSGNYHEYHYGPVRDAQGNLYGGLNVGWSGKGDSVVPYRGWIYQLRPDGTFHPYAVGFRSPCGIGINKAGELFVTDNQGDWWATSPLLHVREGGFYGHPAGLAWEEGWKGKEPDEALALSPESLEPRRQHPAAWFVYGPLGHSPGEPVWDETAGKFGPFAGQMLVGDQTASMLVRVALEKVKGAYQGVAIPFRHGFASGIIRNRFGNDHALYTGGTDRGWGSIGGSAFSLQRLSYTGKMPFEVHSVALRKDGFEITFTKSIDRRTAAAPGSYGITHHGYKYWKTYGSVHQDTTVVLPSRVVVAESGRSAHVVLPGLLEGKVYTISLPGLKSVDGEALLHDTVYYTLNRRVDDQAAASADSSASATRRPR